MPAGMTRLLSESPMASRYELDRSVTDIGHVSGTFDTPNEYEIVGRRTVGLRRYR